MLDALQLVVILRRVLCECDEPRASLTTLPVTWPLVLAQHSESSRVLDKGIQDDTLHEWELDKICLSGLRASLDFSSPGRFRT